MGASKFCQLAWDIGKNTSSPACISLSQDLSHCHRQGFVALAESYALFRKIYPDAAIQPSRKQKSRLFFNFFAIADVVVPGSYMALPFRYEKAFQGEGSS